MAVENEIQVELDENVVDDKEYLECSNWYVNVFEVLNKIISNIIY